MAVPSSANALGYERFNITQGASWSISWVYSTSDDGGTTSTPVDLSSDWIGRCEIRKRKGGTVLARFHSDDVDADGLVALGSDGVVTLSLDPDTSVDWTWTSGRYDVELEKVSTGKVVRLVEGAVVLSPEVTTGD